MKNQTIMAAFAFSILLSATTTHADYSAQALRSDYVKAVTLSNPIQANLISISNAMSATLARSGKVSLEFAPQQLSSFKRSHAASQLNRQPKAGKATQQLAADVSKPVMRGLMGDI